MEAEVGLLFFDWTSPDIYFFKSRNLDSRARGRMHCSGSADEPCISLHTLITCRFNANLKCLESGQSIGLGKWCDNGLDLKANLYFKGN